MGKERDDQSEIDITFFVACYNEEENIIGTLGYAAFRAQ